MSFIPNLYYSLQAFEQVAYTDIFKYFILYFVYHLQLILKCKEFWVTVPRGLLPKIFNLKLLHYMIQYIM